jgi:hypothetical protein
MQINYRPGNYLFDNRTDILTSNNRCNNYYYVDQTQKLAMATTDLHVGDLGLLAIHKNF